MHRTFRLPVLAAAILLAALPLSAPLSAQEHKELGRMWTFEDFPEDYIREEYGFEPTPEFLEHLRLSSLRYGGGCSASFVSPRGLIMTNHHCARGSVGEVSPADEDWLGDGFYAGSLDEEVPIPGLEVHQLLGIEDVTDRMREGVTEDMDAAARREQMNANREAIEQEARDQHPGLRPQVVSLYQGGRHHLYLYKVWDDIRLVAVPHLQSAKFGGDPDNFTYPRFAVDYAFLRAWEGDQPADTSAHYLRWRTEGPTEDELVFVVGNPGSTGRLDTLAQMEFLRDVQYPAILRRVETGLERMNEQAAKDPDVAMALRSEILNLENARKAFRGYLDGLQNERIMEIKRQAEQRIRDAIAADPELAAKYGDAWEKMEALVAEKRELFAAEELDRNRLRELQGEERALAARIGEAYFAVYGTSIPPDATFTLRIADGLVRGFPYNGTIAPFFTSLYGLYARWTEFGGKPPFDLPEPWIQKEKELDLHTPFNLVCTCDIIGGNSGSPLVDTEGRVVGLVFDGNIESLGNRFVFDDAVARTVAVHPAIIILTLRRIFGADALADEIEGKGPGYE